MVQVISHKGLTKKSKGNVYENNLCVTWFKKSIEYLLIMFYIFFYIFWIFDFSKNLLIKINNSKNVYIKGEY